MFDNCGADDGTNCGFYMFIADRAGNLSSGRLYAARMTHNESVGPLYFDVSWVPLHSASVRDADVAGSLGLSFSDLMDYAPYNVSAAAGSACPAGYSPYNLEGVAFECLRIRPGMEGLASVLETRRVAAIRGATTEFTKWEGLTFSPERGVLMTSLTAIRYGMEDAQKQGRPSAAYDTAGPNHIRAAYNPCGCVFELALQGGRADATGAAIGSGWVPTAMTDLLCGMPAQGAGAAGPLAAGADSCDTELPANPDNVAWMGGLDTLLIAEDTDYHVNNVLWAYAYGRGELQRILSTPIGAESTSAYWVPDALGNGWSYIVSSVQHPGAGAGGRGYAGYLGPISFSSSLNSSLSPVVGRGEAKFDSITLAPAALQNSVVATTKFWTRNSMQSISYQTLARSGQAFAGVIFGQLVDSKGQARIRSYLFSFQPS